MGDIFAEEPESWGLRGDPFLWRDLRQRFADATMPETIQDVQRLLEVAFWELTDQSLAFAEDFHLEKYDSGMGMSSGWISGRYWREVGFPELIDRFVTIRARDH
ncbi:hypothetical protein [Marivivens marinus]|uniref:hypothetical protein n=1 Tax=Marivivens marinus TaxID=3110173 RepID=UPI003B849FF0